MLQALEQMPRWFIGLCLLLVVLSLFIPRVVPPALDLLKYLDSRRTAPLPLHELPADSSPPASTTPSTRPTPCSSYEDVPSKEASD